MRCSVFRWSRQSVFDARSRPRGLRAGRSPGWRTRRSARLLWGRSEVNTWNARGSAVLDGWCSECGYEGPTVSAWVKRLAVSDSETSACLSVDRLIAHGEVHLREKTLLRMLYETCTRAEECSWASTSRSWTSPGAGLGEGQGRHRPPPGRPGTGGLRTRDRLLGRWHRETPALADQGPHPRSAGRPGGCSRAPGSDRPSRGGPRRSRRLGPRLKAALSGNFRAGSGSRWDLSEWGRWEWVPQDQGPPREWPVGHPTGDSGSGGEGGNSRGYKGCSVATARPLGRVGVGSNARCTSATAQSKGLRAHAIEVGSGAGVVCAVRRALFPSCRACDVGTAFWLPAALSARVILGYLSQSTRAPESRDRT
ncbi:hypothetical protein ABIA38_007697 [Embleya sp. AB8]